MLPGDGVVDVHGQGFCPTTGYFEQDKQWGQCQCNATGTGPVPFGVTFNLIDITVADTQSSRTFAYYPDLTLSHLSPVSGPSTGGSILSIFGGDFSAAGHSLQCVFRDQYGLNQTVPATAASLILPRGSGTEVGYTCYGSLACWQLAEVLGTHENSVLLLGTDRGNMQQFSEELQFLYYAQPKILRSTGHDPTSVRSTAATELLRTGKVDDAFDSKYKVRPTRYAPMQFPYSYGSPTRPYNVFSYACATRCPVLTYAMLLPGRSGSGIGRNRGRDNGVSPSL
eukprot:230276-Rhodomonas_salina.3